MNHNSSPATSAATADAPSRRLGWREAWRIYRSGPALRMLALGFSAVSAVLIGLLVAAALWRFRSSDNTLIQATWLTSRNDAIKQVFYSTLSFSARVYPERWPEYALDVFAAFLAFQATWKIVAQARRENRRPAVGAASPSV